MSKFQVTFKGDNFDVTIFGDNAQQIVEDYRTLNDQLNKSLGVRRKGQELKKPIPLAVKVSASSQGLPARILDLVHEGFFDSNRRLQEIQEALKKKGVTKPVTTIAPRLMELVQKGLIERDYETPGEKKVWVYRKASV
jgi:hypothetical protein